MQEEPAKCRDADTIDNSIIHYKKGLGFLEARNLKLSEEHFLRSLEILERVLGDKHFQLFFPLTGLGYTYHGLGDIPSAEMAFMRVLSVVAQDSNPDRDKLGGALSNLAWFYEQIGNYARAKETLEGAYKVYEMYFGEGNSQTQTTRKELVALYAKIDKFERSLPQKFDESPLAELERRAAQGDTLAKVALGEMYLVGKVVLADYSRAAQLFIEAAKENNPDAQLYLGSMCEQGWGMRKDVIAALDWYVRAAAAGNAAAKLILANKSIN